MKKCHIKKTTASLFASVTAFIMSAPAIFSNPVFACTCKKKLENGTIQEIPGNTIDAAILKNICDCGNGEAVMGIISLVVRIMTVGIGILGVLGIVIVGIQYLTAGGNEEQTKKAKRRLYEIVIGLAVYAVAYLLLRWLMPNFDPFMIED